MFPQFLNGRDCEFGFTSSPFALEVYTYLNSGIYTYLIIGLTGRNGQGNVEFLHRTYAEYLVADYLYQGFLLDKNRHNKLQEEESMRDFVKILIFRQGEFEGVVTFLDSKLKRLDRSETWRNLIDRCSTSKEVFPNRFQKMVPLNHYDLKNFNGRGKWNILFMFLCGCLDATFRKNKVREVIGDFLIYISYYAAYGEEFYLFSLIDVSNITTNQIKAEWKRFYFFIFST